MQATTDVTTPKNKQKKISSIERARREGIPLPIVRKHPGQTGQVVTLKAPEAEQPEQDQVTRLWALIDDLFWVAEKLAGELAVYAPPERRAQVVGIAIRLARMVGSNQEKAERASQ